MEGTTNAPDQHTGPSRPDTDRPPVVLLVMESGRDRDLLESFLQPDHDVRIADATPFDDPGCDVCLFDIPRYERHHTEFKRLQAANAIHAPPAMLLVGADATHRESTTVWETVDDIVVTPTDPTELEARINRLVREQRRATRLHEREQQLTELVADLDLANRSLDAAPVGVVIIDATHPDKPIIEVNEAFTTLTGYSASELVGNTPRILAGPGTEPEAMTALETAVETGESITTEITNYRADGTRFLDHVETAPVTNDDGTITHFVEFHRDVTRRRLRENRLHVVNRLLRHNLRNDLNQVIGYGDLLATQLDDSSLQQYAAAMSNAATNLVDLGEKLHRAEDALECPAHHDQTTTVANLLDTASKVGDQHPASRVTTHTAIDTHHKLPQIVTLAVEELIDNAVTHHPDNAATVDVTVTDDIGSLITVTVSDDGPGINDGVQTILETGESPLRHGDGVGLWIVKWIADLLGGHISLQGTPDGTTVQLTIPIVSEPTP